MISALSCRASVYVVGRAKSPAQYLIVARALDHEQNGDLAAAVAELTSFLEPGHDTEVPGMCHWSPTLVRAALAVHDLLHADPDAVPAPQERGRHAVTAT